MQVVHPFHPLVGQQLQRVAENVNVVGRRVVCLDSSGAAWAVPIEWTDLAERTLEWEINARRAPVLVDDLLALDMLIMRARQ